MGGKYGKNKLYFLLLYVANVARKVKLKPLQLGYWILRKLRNVKFNFVKI